jgi:hypothetical protein
MDQNGTAESCGLHDFMSFFDWHVQNVLEKVELGIGMQSNFVKMCLICSRHSKNGHPILGNKA